MTVTGNKTTGAVIYTRVSTGEQAEHGTSLDSQRDACRQKALTLSLPIVAEYEDAGVSGGFLLTRQGMMAALADIQAGRASTLICANVSRYSRDVEHQQTLLKSVRAAGGSVVFCDMTFDDTPSGDLMFGMIGQFAQWERQEIKRRTTGGRNKKAEQGVQTARTHSPFGYRIIGQADVLRGEQPAEQMGKYLIVEDQAAIVRELFARYGSGASSLTGLARWLNDSGVPTRLGAAYWRASTVAYILANPVYKGLGVYGRKDHAHDEARLSQRHPSTGRLLKTTRTQRPAAPETWITWSVPAIVTEDIWEATQARGKENKRKMGGNPDRVRMLAGRVCCPACGGGIVAAMYDKRRGQTQSQHYVCGRYAQAIVNTGRRECLPTYYPIAVAESAVVDAIDDGAQRPENVRKVIQDTIAAYNEPIKNTDDSMELGRVEAQLSDLEKKQAAAVKAQIAGIMAGADPAAYNAVFAEIAAQRAALEEKKATFTPTRQEPRAAGRREWTAADFPLFLADVRRVLTSPDVPGDEKRDAVGKLVERVYPAKDGARVQFLPGVFGEDTLQAFPKAFI